MVTLTHPTLPDVTVTVDHPADWLAAGWVDTRTTGPEAADSGTTTQMPRRRTATTKEK